MRFYGERAWNSTQFPPVRLQTPPKLDLQRVKNGRSAKRGFPEMSSDAQRSSAGPESSPSRAASASTPRRELSPSRFYGSGHKQGGPGSALRLQQVGSQLSPNPFSQFASRSALKHPELRTSREEKENQPWDTPAARRTYETPKRAVERMNTPRYGRAASSLLVRRTPRLTNARRVPVSNEPIDLTVLSDEEEACGTPVEDIRRLFRASAREAAPSVQDLIDLTGSSSTGVDATDVQGAHAAETVELDGSKRDSGRDYCHFLLESWVGLDHNIREYVTSAEQTEDGAEGQAKRTRRPDDVVSTLSTPTLGNFSLTAGTLKCLSGPEWLNDEVINAYMGLLSLRTTLAEIAEAQSQLPADEHGAEEGAGDAECVTRDDALADSQGECAAREEKVGMEAGAPQDSDVEVLSESMGSEMRAEACEALAANSESGTDPGTHVSPKSVSDVATRGSVSEEDTRTGVAATDASMVVVADDSDCEEEGTGSGGCADDAPGTEARPRCAFFSSFFYAILRNSKGGYCYDHVKRWGRKTDLASMDHIFFPINVSNSHWCLAVVSPKEKSIRYYDSLGGKNFACLGLLERYMQDEGAARYEEALQGEWQKENVGPDRIPRQIDGCSCGVFACCYADLISAGKGLENWRDKRDDPAFAHMDMEDLRAEMLRLFLSCRE